MDPRHQASEYGSEVYLPRQARRGFQPTSAFGSISTISTIIPIIFVVIFIGAVGYACWRRQQQQSQAHVVQDAGQVAAAPPGTYVYNPNGVQTITVGGPTGGQMMVQQPVMYGAPLQQQAYPAAPYYGAPMPQQQQFPQPGVYGYPVQQVMSSPPPPPQQYNAVNGTPIMRL